MNKMLKLLSAIALVVVLFAGFLLMRTLGNENQEKEFNDKIVEVGKEFYEDFYYDQIAAGKSQEEVEVFLAQFTDIGIKVDLDNMSRFNEGKYSDLTQIFVNKKNDVVCDIHNTRAVIYPKAPFGKSDNKVEAELDCGFETVEKETE